MNAGTLRSIISKIGKRPPMQIQTLVGAKAKYIRSVHFYIGVLGKVGGCFLRYTSVLYVHQQTPDGSIAITSSIFFGSVQTKH
jgi:hypothetical protein